MPRLRTMAGLPVVCGERRVGRLLQAELDPGLRALEGIWVSGGLRGTRYIPAEHLQLLGEAAVMTDDPGRRQRLKRGGLFLRAISTDGRRLGAITGAEIDGLTLAVASLELSSGLWDDLLHGRRQVRRYTARPEKGEVIVDPDEDGKEAEAYEGRNAEGAAGRHGAGRRGGDGIRRHELADGAALEPEDQAGRQLDR